MRMMEERREKQQLQKMLSELREAHRELMEEVEMLRGENNRLKEAMVVVERRRKEGRRRGRRREEERSSPDGQERERVDEEERVGAGILCGKRLLQEVYRYRDFAQSSAKRIFPLDLAYYIFLGSRPSAVPFKKSVTHFSFEDRGSAAMTRRSQLKDPTTSSPQQPCLVPPLRLQASYPLLSLLLPSSSPLPTLLNSSTSSDFSKSSPTPVLAPRHLRLDAKIAAQ